MTKSLKNKTSTLVIILASYAFYLILTAGSGNLLFWSLPELLVGLFASALIGIIFGKTIEGKNWVPLLNPLKWLMFLEYLGYWLIKLTQANLDVATRVITGKINPGIVKIDSLQKKGSGLFLLATSITLTPGTLTVDANEKNELYVHCINNSNRKPSTQQVCGKMAEKIKEIMK